MSINPKRATLLVGIAQLAFQSQIFDDADFRFFLQINKPLLVAASWVKKATEDKVYILKENNRVVQIFPKMIKGDGLFCEEIIEIYDQFRDLAQPSRKAFTFSFSEEGQHVKFALRRERGFCSLPEII